MDQLQMLSGLKQRQLHAFEALFDRYYRRVAYFSMQIVQSKEEAEDIAIHAFSKCWEKAFDFTAYEEIVNFIYLVARNASFNYLDKLKAKNNYIRHHAQVATAEEQKVTDHALVKTEMVKHLYAEIEKLPDQCRVIIKLRYFENLTSSQIAQQLNLSPNTVRVQISRGISSLRQVFSEKELLLLLLLLQEHNPN